MKSIVKTVAMMALVCVVAMKAYNKQNEAQVSDVVLANIEALAHEEGSFGGNTVDCYSSSDGKKGASYYDCGTCKRELNSVGVGSARTCIVR